MPFSQFFFERTQNFGARCNSSSSPGRRTRVRGYASSVRRAGQRARNPILPARIEGSVLICRP